MASYQEQLKSEQWKRKRATILKRDEKKCCICGRKSGLEVHHLDYIQGKLAHEYDDDMLVSLCPRCHEEAHSSIKKVAVKIAYYIIKKGKCPIEIYQILNSI